MRFAGLRLSLDNYFNRPWERVRSTFRSDLLTFLRDANRRIDDAIVLPSGTVTTLDGTNVPGTSETYARGDHKHDDPNRPSDDEKDALSGTSGTPSGTNKYVTDEDGRLVRGVLTADPGAPANDTWWVVREGSSPTTVSLKARIGGVTQTVASMEF